MHFVERNVGAWMHIEHILGLYVFAACNRSGPTNMHNTAMVINSEHKIRFAQDLALYNLTLSEEIEGFDGAAHIDAWNNAAELAGCPQGHRGADRDRRRLGRVHLRHQHRVRAADRRAVPQQPGDAGRRGQRRLRHARPWSAPPSTTTRSATCAGRQACFGPLVADKEFADHNKELMQGWLSKWVPQCLEAARAMQPMWSQPDNKPPRFEDSLDRAKSRFAGIVSDLGLQTPEGADQVTRTFKTAESPYKADNTASGKAGVTLMNNQVGVVVAEVMDRQDNVTVTHLPSMIRVDCVGRMDFVYDDISEALGEEPGFYDAAEFEENMSTHYGKMIHMDDRTVMFGNLEEAAEFIGDMLPPGGLRSSSSRAGGPRNPAWAPGSARFTPQSHPRTIETPLSPGGPSWPRN